MRNISFSLTTPQLLNGTKDVTRRLGWKNLKPGERLCAVEKSRGLKKGQKVKRLAVIEVVSVRRERLYSICTQPGEAKREGFPDLTESQFLIGFADHMKCHPSTEITRIEFRVVEKLI